MVSLRRMMRSALPAAMVGALLAIGSGAALAEAAAASGGVTISAVINGVNAKASTESYPASLSPNSPGAIDLTVTNNSDQPAQVRTVRLQGRVMGLVFYAYDTSVVLDVAAHETQTRH